MNDENQKMGIVSNQLLKEFTQNEGTTFARKKFLPSELFQIYRQRAGITQENLAGLLGLNSRRAVQAWENGESLPGVSRLKKLIEIYLEKSLFAVGQEQEEAERLWNSVKDMHDTATSTYRSYVPFDAYWFEKLPRCTLDKNPPQLPLLPSATNSTAPLATTPHNLPPLFNRLVGRAKQLKELINMLDTSTSSSPHLKGFGDKVRLVTISGPGGIGKTRLALEVAHSLQAEASTGSFRDGVVFCELESLTNSDQLLPAISRNLAFLGWRETTSNYLQSLKTFLRDKHVLLVLDNFEHLIEASPLLGDLLKVAPYLKLLVTSREILNLYAEYNYILNPLEWPPASRKTDFLELTEYGAIELFLERMRWRNPLAAQLTEADLKIIGDICRELDGLPLAIELAVAHTPTLTLAELVQKLDTRLKLLRNGARDLPARQRTLEATLDWGYNLLTPDEQFLFCQLAIFAGSFNLEMVTAVCIQANVESSLPTNNNGLNNSEYFLEGLTSLLNKSLLVTGPNHASQVQRYSLLATIREYALKQLRQLQLANLAEFELHLRAQHANYFMILVEQTNKKLDKTEWLNLVQMEQPNLHQALEWLLGDSYKTGFQTDLDSTVAQATKILAGQQLAVAVAPFWFTRGYPTDGRKWLGKAVEQLENLHLVAIAEVEKAILAHEKLVSCTLPEILATTLYELASFELLQNDWLIARNHLETALELTERSADSPTLQQHRANIFRQLGLLAYQESKYEAAHVFYEKSLAIGYTLNDKEVIAANLNNIGVIALEQGKYTEAITLFEKSLALREELGDKQAMSAAFANLAIIANNQGRFEEARIFYEESLVLYRSLGDKYRVAAILNNLGTLASEQADYKRAFILLNESLELRRELGNQRGIAVSLGNLGYLCYKRGSHYHEEALRYYRESLAFHFEMEDNFIILYNLVGLAGVYLARQQAQISLVLAGCVDNLCKKLSITELDLAYRADYQAIIQNAHAQLTEFAAQTAWKTGQHLPLGKLIELFFNYKDGQLLEQLNIAWK